MELTERHTTTRSRARQEAFLKNILDGLEDAVIVFDREQHVDFINLRGLELFPFHREPRGRLLIEIVRHESLVGLAEECIRSGIPAKRNIEIPGPQKRVFLASAAALDRPQTRFRLIVRDETVSYETEQVRRDFVANASHELRTPLTIINGYLENLLESDVLDYPVTARHFLETMRKHGGRIASIIEDMLTISRLESAAASLRRKPFSLRACVEEVIDRLGPKIPPDRIRLHIEIPPETRIVGDRFYWDQIFFNLLENALKYNPEGPLEITVSFSPGDKADVIRIKDDGIGISRKDAPFVFARFYRSENQPRSGVKGTGLGLSIVRRAVEAHGGEITLESVPGIHTTFTIRLPRSRVDSAPPAGDEEQ
ncbi:MAG TPA: ATP-binding protein [Verrucomicrobiales bacterium]|nr:ATP-binding protein [Verrucomicrobiales bacterium]